MKLLCLSNTVSVSNFEDRCLYFDTRLLHFRIFLSVQQVPLGETYTVAQVVQYLEPVEKSIAIKQVKRLV